MSNKPTKQELDKLAKEINRDQASSSSAEKRVKIEVSFKKAVKKMGRTAPPTNKST